MIFAVKPFKTGTIWLGAISLSLGATVMPAMAAGDVNAANTSWLLFCTALVLLMSIPGLALLYGGLVRSKNSISMLSQILAVVCVVALAWIAYGYSLVFTGGAKGIVIGGLSKAFLSGINHETIVTTGAASGAGLPEYAFVAFQMAFACLAPALMIGAFAERLRFSSVVVIALLWFTFAYVPIAHMAWYGPGMAQIGETAAAVANATTAEARRVGEITLVVMERGAGLFSGWRALDYAGGTVIHINAGIAGLAGALMLGRRADYGRASMVPHSPMMALLGAGLLLIGWLGFNGGSTYQIGGQAALAVLNTVLAGAAAAMSWLAIERVGRGKPSLIGGMSGMLAGLVAITPCAGYVAPMGALAIASSAGVVCYWFCTEIKTRLGFDDTLDVFGIHCVAGILGSLALAVFVSPKFGGLGAQVVTQLGQPYGSYSIATQFLAQIKAVLLTLVWSGYVTIATFYLIGRIARLRHSVADEKEGLDAVDHGEKAYNH